MKRTATNKSKFHVWTIAIIISLMVMACSAATAQVLQQDSLALVAFYNSTGGPNWNNNTNWLTGPVSTWYGVTVENDRVIELIVNSNNLAGTLPDDLGQLTALQCLGMSNDSQLSGELPESLFLISTLKWFGIGYCSLTGTIPNTIGNCSKLIEFSLPENNLTGPIPPEIGNLDSLKFLDLHGNQLSGQIPTELGMLQNLEELELNNNNLSGGLPKELASINSLNTLEVSYNNLSGSIPVEFSYQISYWFFCINNNNFNYLPPFNNWYELSDLNVHDNKFTFEQLESHAQAGYMFFNYNPQDSMGVSIDTTLTPGGNYSIYSGTGGEYTNYKWYKNGELILESTDADTLHIENITASDSGMYTCNAENSLLYELTLYRKPVHIRVDTGAGIENTENTALMVYPNPANKKITLSVPALHNPVGVKIYDLNGKCVLTCKFPVGNNKPTLNIESLLPGIYLLQVNEKNKIYTTKLIINRQGTDR